MILLVNYQDIFRISSCGKNYRSSSGFGFSCQNVAGSSYPFSFSNSNFLPRSKSRSGVFLRSECI